MKRVKLIVAYDGTNYCGWQVQPNAITVEGVLNKTLSEFFKEDITVIGASRTDSGVHAMGNVAVFDTESRMPAEKISYALNQRLPEDIRIRNSEEVPADYHPRHQECRKTYRYRVVASEFPNPMKRLYTHFVYRSLDLEKIKRAAKYLEGTHDFKSFCSVNTQVKDTVRTIYYINVLIHEDEIIFEVNGNGFLYNMIRIIAGTLLQVGMGAIDPEEIPSILAALDRTKAGPTAPAKGLMLEEIKYLS